MRAFVVCNGPSLNVTPLNRMRDEFVIAINRFDLLGLDWDPQWWVLSDIHPSDPWWDFSSLLQRKSNFLFREMDRNLVDPFHNEWDGQFHKINNAFFFPRCEHIGGEYIPDRWHLPKPCEYGGGASVALQLAAHLGKSPIYLVGADLYKYRGPEDPDINHFHPEYCAYRRRKSTGEEVNTPEAWERLNDRLIHAHEVAQRSASEMGIEILNATVGGALDVYPRVDIRDVLAVVE